MLLAAIAASAADAIISADPNGIIITWNPAAVRLFGYAEAEALGQPLARLLPAELRCYLVQGDAGWPGSPSPSAPDPALRLLGLHRNGAEIPITLSLTPWPSEYGTCTTAIIRDAADKAAVCPKGVCHAAAEQQLCAGEERFRQITEHISEVFYVFDLHTRHVLYVSPSYERIWQRSRESLYADGRAFIEPIHPDDRNVMLNALERQARGEATEEVYRLLQPDKSVRWIRDRSFPVYDRNSAPYRVVGLAEDITEQHTAEQLLRQTNESLERRVAERTAALSEANSQLERAARLKDEFLANMSHELRTPLNAILTLSESTLEGVYGALNERQTQALDAIAESGQHLLALINDILDLTKIEVGKVELAIETLDVDEICVASLRMVRQIAQTKQLHIVSSIDPLVETVSADPRRLKQILVNLLSNAVKFTPAGGSISLVVQADPAAEVIHFTVSDTGMGITADDITRLFKPFVQLDSCLSRRHEGTGLGLALVASLADLHGGAVTVTSTCGVGSSFMVSLPWQARASEAAQAPAPDLERRVGPDPHETPVLLLAEDNETVLQTTSRYLEAHGYRVLAARNGIEAVSLAEEWRPDVILMDIQMPVMEGLEATRRIRASPAIAATPLIALTALAMMGDYERCLAAGADAYLSKPVSLRRLIEQIEHLRRARHSKLTASR